MKIKYLLTAEDVSGSMTEATRLNNLVIQRLGEQGITIDLVPTCYHLDYQQTKDAAGVSHLMCNFCGVEVHVSILY